MGLGHKIGDLVVLNSNIDACIFEIVTIEAFDLGIRPYQQVKENFRYVDYTIPRTPSKEQMENFIKNELFCEFTKGKTSAWDAYKHKLDMGEIKAKEVIASLEILEKCIDEIEWVKYETDKTIYELLRKIDLKVKRWNVEAPF